MMNKKAEFVERFCDQLKRFTIKDKFSNVDSNIARIHIANVACQILEQMAGEIDPVEVEIPVQETPVEEIKQVQEISEIKDEQTLGTNIDTTA